VAFFFGLTPVVAQIGAAHYVETSALTQEGLKNAFDVIMRVALGGERASYKGKKSKGRGKGGKSAYDAKPALIPPVPSHHLCARTT